MAKNFFTSNFTKTNDINTHFPWYFKLMMKSYKSPFDNPDNYNDIPKIREMESKMMEGLMGKIMYGKLKSGVEIVSKFVSSKNLQIPIYILSRKKLTKTIPLIIYFHGGGYVTGNMTSCNIICSQIVKMLDCCVISVDYRLAPEWKFPAPIVDGQNVLRWVSQHFQEMHVDPKHIYLMGDSAGGGIATILTLINRDQSFLDIAGQILIYPWIDADLNYKSIVEYAEGYGLTKSNLELYRQLYITSEDDLDNPNFSAIKNSNFTNLPPTLLVTASHDPIRDQGFAYAQKIYAAGNQIIFKNYQPTIHGFFTIHKILPKGKKMFRDVLRSINEMICENKQEIIKKQNQ